MCFFCFHGILGARTSLFQFLRSLYIEGGARALILPLTSEEAASFLELCRFFHCAWPEEDLCRSKRRTGTSFILVISTIKFLFFINTL